MARDRISKMKKSDLKILIVEDDKTLSEALKQAVTRAGYQAMVCHNPAEALAQQKNQIFAALVVDCLLPKISGVDLVAQIRAGGDLAGQVILMSGIFKDKAFVKEAMTKSGAGHFLTKPFGADDLVRILDTELASLIDDSLPPLVELSTKDNPTPGEKVNAIKATPSIHGFEIPRILGLVMSAGSFDGILQLVDPEGKQSRVHFQRSRIVRVESQDRQSYFGSLLIEKKLLTHERLEAELKQPNTKNKRLGERLVDANLLSPHYIAVVNAEQMAIRLSMMVQDTSYELSLNETTVSEPDGVFDKPNLASFFNDCVDSKLPLDWLKKFYLSWLDSQTKFTKSFTKSNPILTYGSLSRLKNITGQIETAQTLSQLSQNYREREQDFFSGIHLLFLNQLIHFERKAKVVDTSLQSARLKQLQAEFQNKDDFEILGLPRRCKTADIKRAYYDLSKTYHPDKLPPNSDKILVELTKNVFSKVTTAYNRLIDDEKRANYLKELEVGQASKVMEAERIIDEGKTLLKTGQATKALEKFMLAGKLRPMNSDLQLHLIWAQLASLSANSPKAEEILAEVSLSLNKIPPEDRHNAFYYFVKALYQKHVGDHPSALDNLNHAVSIRPEFIEAKRELNLLLITMKKGPAKPTSILNADLKDVVGMLFKRK
jgi:ActR/RegA family two-component response regulator/curved DNA-binding protein CbpA